MGFETASFYLGTHSLFKFHLPFLSKDTAMGQSPVQNDLHSRNSLLTN